VVEGVGQGEDDVEVGDGEQIGASRFEPVFLVEALALGAVAVAAGVVDGAAVTTAVTLLEMATQGGGAAGREGAKDLVLEGAQRVRGAVAVPVPAEDLSQVRRGRVSCRSL
jgi:hypothetical protein